MDAQVSNTSSATPASDGAVEPAKQAGAAKDKSLALRAEPRERYEPRDPFAETSYRSNSFAHVIAKPDQLGSPRLPPLAPDGIAPDSNRTPVAKTAGDERRSAQRPPLPERPLDPVTDTLESSVRAAKSTPREMQTETARVGTAKPVHVEAQAARATRIAELEADLHERYIIKRAPLSISPVTVGHTEYRFRGDTSRIAFTESTFRLVTDTNSPSVTRSMVDVALARGWAGLRVDGSEDFRRLVWLEASLRSMKAIGYEPDPADLDVLKRERDARLTDQIEQVRAPGCGAAPTTASASADKAGARGSGGRRAVLAAIDAVLVAKHVPVASREAVLAAATEQLALRSRAGQNPKVKVYDGAAPPQRRVEAPAREVSRLRARAAPTPNR